MTIEKPTRPDPLRDQIAERVEKLGLTAYAVAKACDIDPDTVRRYLTGRVSLNSRYVSAILTAVGWDGAVRWSKSAPEKYPQKIV